MPYGWLVEFDVLLWRGLTWLLPVVSALTFEAVQHNRQLGAKLVHNLATLQLLGFHSNGNGHDCGVSDGLCANIRQRNAYKEDNIHDVDDFAAWLITKLVM